jgi:hypothetical protein
MARAQGLEEEDPQARKLEVEKRESSVKDLEKHLTSALEKATAEQRAFEETSSSKLNQLQDNEEGITEKLNDLRALESNDSRVEAILVLKQTIGRPTKQGQRHSRAGKGAARVGCNDAQAVDALVDKAAVGLRKETIKEEEKIQRSE